MILWLADHPWLGERLLLMLNALPAFFSHVIGISGGVRRLVAFPWSRSLDFEGVAGIEQSHYSCARLPSGPYRNERDGSHRVPQQLQ
jgi:hypothetical protein